MNGNNSNTANRKGTGFTNLQTLIGANKNNQMGQSIQAGVGGRVSQIQTDLNRSKNEFQTGLDKNKVTDADKSFVDSKLNDPISASNEDATKFQGLMKGQYAGPSGLQNTAKVETQANELNQYGQNIGSAAGRYGLLQRYIGGNKYTQGQQRLDNAILGQTGTGELKDVRRQAMSLSGDVNQAKTSAQALAQDASQRSKVLGQDIVKRLGTVDDPTTPENEAAAGTVYGDLYNDLKSRTDGFNEAQRALELGLSGKGGQYQLTRAQLDELGISPGQTYHGLNLSNYINAAPYVDATIQQIANEDDYSKYQALNRLSGRQGSLLTDDSTLNSAKEYSYSGLDKDRLKETLDLNKQAQTMNQNLLSRFETLLPKALSPQATFADLNNIHRIYQALTGTRLRDSAEFDSLMTNPAKVQEFRDMVNSGKSLENMASALDWLHTYGNQSSSALEGDIALRDMVGGESSYNTLLNYLRRLSPGSSSTLGAVGAAPTSKIGNEMTSGDPLGGGFGSGKGVKP